MLIDIVAEYDQEKIDYLKKLRENILLFLARHEDPKKIVGFFSRGGILSINDQDKTIQFGFPNDFVLTQVKKFFTKSLNTAVQECYNVEYKATIFVYSQFQTGGSNPLQIDVAKLLKTQEVENIILDGTTKTTITNTFGILFEKKFNFDNYVVGPNNNLAFSAAKAVAESPGKAYNPLFIYGGVGLGKTHLMQAIANYAIQKEKIVVLYLPASKLIDDIVSGIRKNKLSILFQKFEGVDMLLVDDIQFLAGKDKTQEIFHTIFNEFVSKGKQVVMSSDRPPRELELIEDRLKSRFAHGLVCDIQQPGYETRLAILQEKLSVQNTDLDSEFLQIIATCVKDNVRELEGALNLFLTKQTLLGKTLDEKDIYEGLKNLGYESNAPKQFQTHTKSEQGFDDLVVSVCDYYGVDIELIKGQSKKKEHGAPRQLLMYIAKKHYGRTLERIGLYFGGKNHATVIHSISTFEKRLKTDIDVAQDYARFSQSL